MSRAVGRLAGLMVCAVLLSAAPAHADSTFAADPSAVNVARHGDTVAWSRRAPDGTHRLVVRTPEGTFDADVRPSATRPFDPDVGPDAAGDPVIVYAREDGDLYLHRPGLAGDHRLASASAPDATEAAPSTYGGITVFARTDGPRPGLYVSRPGRRPRRLNTSVPAETDSSRTRVVSRHGPGTVRLSTLSGDQQRTIARAYPEEDDRLASPSLGAAGPHWLRVGPDSVSVERLGRGGATELAQRNLPATTTALTVSGGPALYADAQGLRRVSPVLVFTRAAVPDR